MCAVYFFLNLHTKCDFGANFYFSCVRGKRQLHLKIRYESSVLKLLLIGALKANVEALGKI